jgi:sulfonate dioxygenase
MSAIATVTETLPALKLHHESNGDGDQYPYTHLLPTFDSGRYPPLTPFRHEDPGHRALSHADPLTFLQSASRVQEMTPVFGTEVEGINLSRLTPSERDQLALLVARRGLVVFRGQNEFIDSGTDAYLEWGRYFGRPHIHPTSPHPLGVPEIHLVYRDANSTYNYELDDRITTTSWHTDVSYELQPPGLTTFFLLSARRSS